MSASQFFLGANTPTGFSSLYGELIDRETARAVYILKGGPGCGKSSFMRRVGRHAEAAGYAAQYILCSGDPGSLDALILPELNTALVDGTAPHIIEPSCPGVVDHYINLGRYYDGEALQASRSGILAHMEKNGAAYRQCYRRLAAAGGLEEDTREAVLTEAVAARLRKRARGIAARELKREGGQEGKVTRRFLSAISCQGRMTLWDTVAAQARRVYELCDGYGLAHELLIPILQTALARGYDAIACMSPMAPERMEHLLIPALELAFVTSTHEQPYPGHPYRRIHLESIAAAGEDFARIRTRVRFAQKVSASLLEDAIHALEQAKTAHDALESLYNPHVDFDGVYGEAESLAHTIIPIR